MLDMDIITLHEINTPSSSTFAGAGSASPSPRKRGRGVAIQYLYFAGLRRSNAPRKGGQRDDTRSSQRKDTHGI
jgi:hypothetical protein